MGLYYLNARYYNPEDGRFLTEDTYRGETGEPDTWHLYAYCNNDPVNYVDPSGHNPIAVPTGWAIGKLLKEMTYIVVGVTYVLANTAIKKLQKKQPKIKYYKGYLINNNVYIGAALKSKSKAASRMKVGKNVLSLSSHEEKESLNESTLLVPKMIE